MKKTSKKKEPAERECWVPACICGKPVEGHIADEIHDVAVVPPREEHADDCRGHKWPVFVDVQTGRCRECKCRVAPPKARVMAASETAKRAEAQVRAEGIDLAEDLAEAAERAEGKKMLDVIRDGERAYSQGQRLQTNPHPVQGRLGIAWMFGWRRAQNAEGIRDLLYDLQSLQTWVEQEERAGKRGRLLGPSGSPRTHHGGSR